MEVEEILETFESLWDDGQVPDIFSFADRCSKEDLASSASELIQIDIERRWRSGIPGLPLELSQYLEILPSLFSQQELVELVCWEYGVRNQWGDCISRKKVHLKYGGLDEQLLGKLDNVSEEIPWPSVSIVIGGQAIVEMRLDRDVTAGRQSDSTQKPWSVVSDALAHHIVLCESKDASLSRNQLAISLNAPDSVVLHNVSANRAVAVRGRGALDSGETLTCSLPVFIHLGAARYLRITGGKTSSDESLLT